MKLSSAVQECLVALLLYDDGPKGGKIVRNLVPPKLYGPFYRDIASDAADYIDKYGKVPGDHTADLVDSLKERNPKKADVYDQLYDSLQDTRLHVNPEYVLSKARVFIDRQRVHAAVTLAVDCLQKDTEEGLLEAKEGLLKALKPSADIFDSGVFLDDKQMVLSFLDEEEIEDVFPLGVKELDEQGINPLRGTLLLFLGIAKFGKTWFCCNATKNANLAGRSVCYISLEVSAKVLTRRMLMAYFSLTKKEAKDALKRMKFSRDELGRFVDFHSIEIPDRPALRNPRSIKFIRKRLNEMRHRARVNIKQFPTGSIKVRDIEAYLDSLEAGGFIPDLLIVDMPRQLDLPTDNFRLALGKAYMDLRGVAVKRNIAVIATHHGNREGAKTNTLGGANISEDFSIAGTVDGMITGAKSDAEAALGLARLKVEYFRDEAQGFTVLLSQNYGIGQFCMDSVRMNDAYFDRLKRAEDGAEEGEDEDE